MQFGDKVIIVIKTQNNLPLHLSVLKLINMEHDNVVPFSVTIILIELQT